MYNINYNLNMCPCIIHIVYNIHVRVHYNILYINCIYIIWYIVYIIYRDILQLFSIYIYYSNYYQRVYSVSEINM
jgi:hypothetical protein